MMHPATRIEVRRAASGPHLDVRLIHGAFAPRLLDRDGSGARVALVSVVALLLAGDDVRLEVVVGSGMDLEVIETAGTVAYDMNGGSASWSVDVTVEDDARLTWLGLPFVVAGGARVTRTTRARVGARGALALRETVVCGRSGEAGGHLVQHTEVYAEGQPVLVESLDLDVKARRGFAALAGRRCVDSLTHVGGGCSPIPDASPGVVLMPLAGPGWIARSIVDELHRSGIPSLLASGLSPKITVR